MVDLAILIGIFSYLVFGLGILGKLGELRGLGVIFFLVLTILVVKKKTRQRFGMFWREVEKDKLSVLIVSLFFLQAIVNLVGALGPELGFDALWYHLTIPKIFLEQKRIFFIPGGLFYYSAMPKLTEMLYLVSLAFSNLGILAKIVHFSFGILSAIALYNLAKRFLNVRYSLLTTLIFYTSLIVGWQSTTAYVDLSRTFFEILALDCFLRWFEGYEKGEKGEKGNWNLADSAVMLGLAISTKLIAFASLPIFFILILWKSKKILLAVCYWLFAVLIPLPWFVFSFLYTRNPFYPIFSGILDQSHKIVSFNIVRFAGDFLNLLFHPVDPITPVFLIFLPIVLLRVIKGQLKVELRVLLEYCFLTYLFWYFTPRTGGSRFILPYLSALSLLTVGIVSRQKRFYQEILFLVCVINAVLNISYRALANKKYLALFLGRQTREQFLSQNLNFEFGDFFDTDGEIKKIVKNDDLVLIYGSHNLFYVNFPFGHESCAKKGTYFSYVLTQGAELPKSLGKARMIYQNPQTRVNLYLYGNKL